MKINFRNNKLLLVICIGLVLRLGVALALGDTVEVLPGIFDQVSYHTLATRVLDGHGFSFAQQWWPITGAGEPTAMWSFLYTFYLVAVYGLFGVHPLAGRLIQAVLVGLFMPWLAARLSERVFPGRGITFKKITIPVSLLAAAWVAFYPYFLYYAGALMTESFTIIGILWSLDVALRIEAGDERRRRWLELGLAMGMSVLLRQVTVVLVPLVAAWLWWARWQNAGRGWANLGKALLSVIRQGLLAACILVLMIAPFTLYNYLRFNRLVLLNTNAGYAFFWSNNPIHGTKFIPLLPSYQDLIPVELRGLDEAALEQALMQRGWQFVFNDPKRFLLLTLSRIPEHFRFWPSSDSSLESNLTRVASLGVALPFMLFGSGLWLFAVIRRRLALAPGLLLQAFAWGYAFVHIVSWPGIRYRLPTDSVLLLFAAYALCWCLNRIWKLGL